MKSEPTSVPAWAADAIWYQIFVARFRNGEKSNDPEGCKPWSHDWTAPAPDGQMPSIHDLFNARYGGDLQGVIEKLRYLKDLGVNTLYLNPIFDAETEHKYDASDHRHVDPAFGGISAECGVRSAELALETPDPKTWQWTDADRVFLELLERAHAAGIRVVIDGVFNHVGQGFWAWKDVLENGKDSPYAGWFEVLEWGPPLRWAAWDGVNGRLVRFKRTDDGLAQPVEDYLFAVTRRWMDPDGDGDPSDGIDGWRLDAAEQVHHGFWKRWRKLVKSVNPQALIVGEIWPPAGEWLAGDEFDVVTNYPFAVPVVRWARTTEFRIQNSEFKKETAAGSRGYPTTVLVAELERLRNAHPWPVTLGMMNLLGSHDTDRLASMTFNPGREYDKDSRPGQGQPFYNNGRPDANALRRARLAALFQFTYVGAPLIYYGDELGMYGGDDPYCRAPMWWPDLTAAAGPIPDYAVEMRDYYRSLIRLRRDHAALRRGDLRLLLADDVRGVLAFERRSEPLTDGVPKGPVVVVLNASGAEQQVKLALSGIAFGEAVDRLKQFQPGGPPEPVRLSADGRIEVTLQPVSGTILVGAGVATNPQP